MGAEAVKPEQGEFVGEDLEEQEEEIAEGNVFEV